MDAGEMLYSESPLGAIKDLWRMMLWRLVDKFISLEHAFGSMYFQKTDEEMSRERRLREFPLSDHGIWISQEYIDSLDEMGLPKEPAQVTDLNAGG